MLLHNSVLESIFLKIRLPCDILSLYLNCFMPFSTFFYNFLHLSRISFLSKLNQFLFLLYNFCICLFPFLNGNCLYKRKLLTFTYLSKHITELCYQFYNSFVGVTWVLLIIQCYLPILSFLSNVYTAYFIFLSYGFTIVFFNVTEWQQ